MRVPALREAAAKALCERLGVGEITFHASGRDALCTLLGFLAQRSGRNEVVLPAYSCYSVAAAAAAAGLRVRLVDVTSEGAIDPHALAKLPLERAAAVVVCNLFGLAEPLSALREIAERTGVGLIDDAAQAFGASDPDGPAGGRAEHGVLSFGRGKPLCALGGGAITWRTSAPVSLRSQSALVSEAPSRTVRLKARAYSLALHPLAFWILASIPALHIGETRFDPCFARGEMDPASIELLRLALEQHQARTLERAHRARALALEISETTRGRPLIARADTTGVYPRLAVLAPCAVSRTRALVHLNRIGCGATSFYPAALCDVESLAPHLIDRVVTPTARQLASRILTLPTHAGLRGARRERMIEVLRSVWAL